MLRDMVSNEIKYHYISTKFKIVDIHNYAADNPAN